MQRRAFLAAATGAALATPQATRAQPWPARPIRIVVPFGLGGSADVAARFLAEPLSAALGVPVIVENRPGGGAVIGTEAAAKAAPDGHTLLMMSNTHTANETLIPNRPYVLLRDLAPVAAVNVAYHVLAVHPALPAATLPWTGSPRMSETTTWSPPTPPLLSASASVAMTSAPRSRTRRSFNCFALSASAFSSESKSRGLRMGSLHRWCDGAMIIGELSQCSKVAGTV